MKDCSKTGDDFLFKEHTITHCKIAYEHMVNGNKMCLTGLCDRNLTLHATSDPINGRNADLERYMSVSHELYEPVVFWEAEEPALILRHRAHHNGTERIKLTDIPENLS